MKISMKNNPFVKLLDIYNQTNKLPNAQNIQLALDEINIPSLSDTDVSAHCGLSDTICLEYKHYNKSTGLIYNRIYCTIIFGRNAGDILFTFGDYVQKEFKDDYNKLSSKLIKEFEFSHDYYNTFVYRRRA